MTHPICTSLKKVRKTLFISFSSAYATQLYECHSNWSIASSCRGWGIRRLQHFLCGKRIIIKKKSLNIITYLIKQIVGLFHKSLLMVLFSYDLKYTQLQLPRDTEIWRRLSNWDRSVSEVYCRQCRGFPVEGKSKAVDRVLRALDRWYLLSLGFHNRKINCSVEISLQPPLQSNKSLYNT